MHHIFDNIKTNQGTTIQNLVNKYCFEEAKDVDLPIYASVYLRESAPHFAKCNSTEYHYVMASLKYPATVSQSDIALVTSVLASFNQDLLMKYMSAAKRVLKYLKTTCNMAIHYRWSGHLNLVGYCDDSFGLHSVETMILGYVFTLA